MASGKIKGNSFEREICSLLSNWWQEGRSDIFWRTASSGGRATQRSRRGKATKNHNGDITATDPIGQPFLDIVTVELKRGYSKYSVGDLLDKLDNASKHQYEEWIEGVIKNADDAKSLSWLLIVKRDRKKPVVFTSMDLLISLRSVAGKDLSLSFCPYAVFTLNIGEQRRIVVGMTLEGFLSAVKPSLFTLLSSMRGKETA